MPRARPLGSGSYVELDMATNDETALQDPLVLSLAAAKGASAAQLILRWHLQRGLAVIPKVCAACGAHRTARRGGELLA